MTTSLKQRMQTQNTLRTAATALIEAHEPRAIVGPDFTLVPAWFMGKLMQAAGNTRDDDLFVVIDRKHLDELSMAARGKDLDGKALPQIRVLQNKTEAAATAVVEADDDEWNTLQQGIPVFAPTKPKPTRESVLPQTSKADLQAIRRLIDAVCDRKKWAYIELGPALGVDPYSIHQWLEGTAKPETKHRTKMRELLLDPPESDV